MDINQKSRHDRNKRIKTTVEKPEILPLLVDIPGFVAKKASFDAHIQGVETEQQLQFTLLRGLIAAKKAWRIQIIPICVQCSAGLVALGTHIADAALVEQATFTKSSLKKLSYSNLVVAAQTLHSLGTTNSTALADFYLPPAFFENFETTLDGLKVAIDAVKTANDEQKKATSAINLHLKEADEDLWHISLKVATIQETQPEAYLLFQTAYHIINAGGSSISVVGYVMDADSSEPLHKARLKITGVEYLEEPPTVGETNEGPVKKTTPSYTDFIKSVKFTSPNGVFKFKNMPSGTYELTVYMSGYVRTTVTLYVNTGNCYEVFVRLQKAATAVA